MTPINNIGDNLNPADRIKQQDKVQSSKSKRAPSNAASAPVEGATAQDSVKISPAAKELAAIDGEIARAREHLQSLKTEDSAKVDDIRQRIESGEFDSPEVTAAVADVIGNLPQFQALIAKPSTFSPAGEAHLEELSSRIRSGQYDSANVLEKVATNILNDLGAL